MIYLVPFVLAIILRFFGLQYNDELGRGIAEIVLAFAIFADVVKLRVSVLLHYHRSSLISTLIALVLYGVVLWATLPNEVWQLLLPLLILASYDIRTCKEVRKNEMIPPRIREFLSLDGIVRTLVIAFLLSPVLRLDWTSTVYSILMGGGIGFCTIVLLYLTRQNRLLFVVPFVAYFLGKQFVGEGIIVLLVGGLLVGNLFRQACVDLITAYGKYYPYLLSFILFLFGLKFGETLFHSIRIDMVLSSVFLVFLLNGVAIAITFLFMKMQWQTYVFSGLSNMPGIVAFTLTILAFEANHGFLPGILSISFILHALYLPRLALWYGEIFTGRDTCSKLEEHKPTVELPY